MYIDVAAGIAVSAIDGLTFDSCWFTDAASNLNFIITIDRCRQRQATLL